MIIQHVGRIIQSREGLNCTVSKTDVTDLTNRRFESVLSQGLAQNAD